MSLLKPLKSLKHGVTIVALLSGMNAAAFAQTQSADMPDGNRGTSVAITPGDGLDRGQALRTEVEKWSDRVRTKIAALDASFQDLDLRKIEVQKLSREKFEAILDDLDEESALILRSFADVQPDVKLLRQTLEKVPGVFLQIGTEFEDEAAKTEDSFFRESYTDLAAASRKMAESYERKAKSMDALERELQSKLKFVQISQSFCGHIRWFLRTIPTEPGIESEKWVQRVNEYVAAMQQAIKLLKSMTEGMDGKPTADPKAAVKPMETSAAVTALPTPPARPMSMSEAKVRLAQLKN